MKNIFPICLLMGLFLFFTKYAVGQSVDVQFVENPNNSDCANGSVCYVIQVRSDDGGVLLGNSSIRFTYDPNVIFFDGFSQDGATSGNYLNTGTYTDINFTSLPVCPGQNYFDHSYDGSFAGDFLISIVFNQNIAFPYCVDLTSGEWIDVSEICFQIIDPSGNPMLAFQGNENGPSTAVDLDGTGFNDGTNSANNKYLNGSFGHYNSIALDNSCNCTPLIVTENSIPISSGAIEAIQAIFSAGQVSTNGTVIMKAGNEIDLNPSFTVKQGGELGLIIAPICNL